MVYLQRQAPAVLALDFMHALHIDSSSLGMMTAAFFYPYAMMQIPAGMICRALGPRTSLIIFFGIASLATIGFGFVSGVTSAVLARILVGLGLSMVLVPMLEIISERFPAHAFGPIVGLLMAIGGLGVFVGGGPLAYLDAWLGWRRTFLALGVFSLSIVCLAPLAAGSSANNATRQHGPNESLASYRQILGVGAFWPPTLWAFFALSLFVGFGGLWAGPYLIHVYDMPKIQAGHILSMLAVGMIIGSPLLSFMVGRLHISPRAVLSSAGLVLTALMGTLIYRPDSLPIWGLYVWFFVLGMASMAATPIALMVVRNRFAGSSAGIATGLFNFFCLIGGATMQPVAGQLIEQYGGSLHGFEAAHYLPVFWVYLIGAVASLIAAVAIASKQQF